MKIIWERDEDLQTWRATTGGYELVVTRLGLDQWEPKVWKGGTPVDAVIPTAADRATAQQRCEQEAARMRREPARSKRTEG